MFEQIPGDLPLDEAEAFGGLKDRFPLGIVDLSIGPGRLDKRDDREGGEDLDVDIEHDQLSEDGLIGDAGDPGEGFEIMHHFLESPFFIGQGGVLLEKEQLLETLAPKMERILLVTHAPEI